MIRFAGVAFVLAVATSAQAMSPAPLHQPDGMTTQARKPANSHRATPPVRYENGAVHDAGKMASACWCYLPGPANRATAGVPHGVRAFALNTTEVLRRATDAGSTPSRR